MRAPEDRAGTTLLLLLAGFAIGAVVVSATIEGKCRHGGSAALFHSDNSIKCEVERVPVPAKS